MKYSCKSVGVCVESKIRFGDLGAALTKDWTCEDTFHSPPPLIVVCVPCGVSFSCLPVQPLLHTLRILCVEIMAVSCPDFHILEFSPSSADNGGD